MSIQSGAAPTTAVYDSTKLHLHQLVKYQYPHSGATREMIVTSLGDGKIEISDGKFGDSITVEESWMDRVTPVTATDGTPVFGY